MASKYGFQPTIDTRKGKPPCDKVKPQRASEINAIAIELDRANAIHGDIFASLHEGIAVIREEYLELEHEVFHGSPAQAHDEAIQLGAMAAKMIRTINAKTIPPPPPACPPVNTIRTWNEMSLRENILKWLGFSKEKSKP